MGDYGAPTHMAMADAMSSIRASVTIPIFRRNRVSETDFTWKASAPESLAKTVIDGSPQENEPRQLRETGLPIGDWHDDPKR